MHNVSLYVVLSNSIICFSINYFFWLQPFHKWIFLFAVTLSEPIHLWIQYAVIYVRLLCSHCINFLQRLHYFQAFPKLSFWRYSGNLIRCCTTPSLCRNSGNNWHSDFLRVRQQKVSFVMIFNWGLFSKAES